MLIPFGVFSAGVSGGETNSFELISTTLVGSATASVTFTSGGTWANYKHLQLRTTLLGPSVGNSKIQYNGDTGANYVFHYLVSNTSGGTVSSGASTGATYNFFGNVSEFANVFSAAVTDILDINSTTKNKTLRSLAGQQSTAGNASATWLSSGAWLNTAAITSLVVSLQAGNIQPGSRLSLYGIKG